jgi:hypothetical protein
MQVGDILIYNGNNIPFCWTDGKHYNIYKIDDNYIPGHLCGWIRDDSGAALYFKECDAEDKNWHYLKSERKKKLQQLQQLHDICNHSLECDYETKLKKEIKQHSCKFKKYHSGQMDSWFVCEDETKLEFDKEKNRYFQKYSCNPDIFCFPEILRRKKLRKLKHISSL